MPATMTPSTLTQEIGVLTDALRPAAAEAINNFIEDLNSRGFAYPTSISPEKVLEEYAAVLSRYSVGALSKARRKLRDGEFDKFRGFLPTPAEFAEIVRREQRVISEDLARARAKLEAITPEPAIEKTAEAKARVRALLGQFRASVAASKAQERGAVADDSVSPEMADMWAKIMDLPDAKEVGIEQIQYRNAVRAKLAKASQPDEDSTNREAGHFGSRSNDWRGHRLVIDEMNRRAEETR